VSVTRSDDPQGSLAVELARALFPSEIDMVEFVGSGGALPPELAERIAPDLEVGFFPPALGGGIQEVGLTGLIEGWREWLEPYESYVIEIEDFEEVGDEQAVILVRVRARTHRDGVVIEHAPAALATVSGGMLVSLHFHLDRDAARADAGG
jgi:hypothetical protein